MSESKIIVVPWDFSNHAKAALKFALKNYSSDEIRVICVLEPPNPYGPGMNWGPEVEEKAIASCVQDFFEAERETVGTGLQFFAEFGEPSDEIIKFAKKQEADLIVLSTHGRTGIKKLFMGSIAQKIVSKATCPIMMLPNKWFDSLEHDAHEEAANAG